MTLDEKSTFNDRWLQAWTDKDIPALEAMYAADCTYNDASTANGLTGRAALIGYLHAMFPRVPAWRYEPDAIWEIEGGYVARWFCQMGEVRLRGLDFVLLKDGQIIHNEVYTHTL